MLSKSKVISRSFFCIGLNLKEITCKVAEAKPKIHQRLLKACELT
jgi:hypothetical protein